MIEYDAWIDTKYVVLRTNLSFECYSDKTYAFWAHKLPVIEQIPEKNAIGLLTLTSL